MPEPIKILIGILTTYERDGWAHPHLLKWVADLPMNPVYATRIIPIHNFQPAAAGRNVFCKQMKENKEADWLCMIDNDMPPPLNMLDVLKDAPEDAAVIVPAFWIWQQDRGALTLCWGVAPGNEPKGNEFIPGWHELNKCGTGVIFIRPWVFDKISYPYFRYVYNEDGGMEGTEDIQFCHAVIAAGLKIYGNSSIRVGHYKSIDLERLQEKLDKMKREVIALQQSASPAESKAQACPA